MGVVYRAFHEGLQRDIALKVIGGEQRLNEVAVRRFHREASVCAAIHHPNVIRILDYGSTDHLVWYSMELLEAPTLGKVVEDREQLSVDEALRVAGEVARGLACIHDHGFVHRDVKPANVVYGPHPRVTIMDFGLVRGSDSETLTKSGTSVGSPRYMSPELIQSSNVEPASDVFQVGLILYETLTAVRPFKGDTITLLAKAILFDRPAVPSTFVRQLDPLVDNLVMRCLAKEPKERPTSGSELVIEIDRCRSALGFLSSSSTNTAPPSPKAVRRRPRSTRERADCESKPAPAVTSSNDDSSEPRGVIPSTRFATKSYAVLLLLLLVLPWYLSADRSYDSFNQRIDPDERAVVINWNSTTAYPSQVRIWPDNSPHDSREEFGESPARRTTEHSVVIRDLQPGISYLYAVIYPDGTSSLARRVNPGPVDSVRLDSHSISWPDLTTVKVTMTTALPCRLTASWILGSIPAERRVTTTPARTHELIVRDVPPLERLRDFSVVLDTSLSSTRVSLSSPGGSADIVDVLRRATGSFDAAATLSRLYELLGTGASPRDTAETRLLVYDATRDCQSWATLEHHRHLVPQLFEVLPPPRAWELYRILRVFEVVDQFLDDRRSPATTEIRELHDRLLEPSWDQKWPDGSFISLFSLDRRDANFEPVSATVTPGAQITGFASNRRLDVTEVFSLDTLPKRARVVLRLRNLTPAFFVSVCFNDAPPLDIRSTADHYPPLIMMAPGSADE